MKEKCLLFSYIFHNLESATLNVKLKISKLGLLI